jgi:NodT family efflux transporter outer membrane factor (OMF) lipoprotein
MTRHIASGRSVLTGVSLALLAACAVPPAPKPADYGKQALPTLQTPAQWTAGQVNGAVAAGWLSTFDDQQLKSLVTEAVANNPDLRVAAARVQVAAEYAQLADSTLWPQVNLLARGGGKMSGDSSGLAGVGLFANWELDLWGRARSQKAAQYATYASAAADAEYARQSVAALTAKAYFLAVEAGVQQQVAESMVTSAEQLSTLAGQREQVGSGDGYEAALARASIETFRDTVEQFKLAREQALRALEALLGRYPAAQVQTATELARVPGPVPAGLPSELLERRPDVIAADRRIAAAFYRTFEAKAARLPRISLTASVNDISSDLFVLKNRDNPVWSAGASLMLPVFTGGALKQQVKIRTAEQKQAIAEYGQVGARAFSEVENALSAEFAAKRREDVLTRAVGENQHALDLSNVRYRVGSGDLRGVQQQQLALYASRTALVRVQTEQLVQRVNVYLALGGGFDTTGAAATPVAASTK